jgi:hypothetical protein
MESPMLKNLAIVLGLVAGLSACMGPYGYSGYGAGYGYNRPTNYGYGYSAPANYGYGYNTPVYYGGSYDPDTSYTSPHGSGTVQ